MHSSDESDVSDNNFSATNPNKNRNITSDSGFQGTQSADDEFKIMIATDIHLGYKENDPIRGNDSFNSFEEILQIARKEDVDFILLGGDLFHDSKPSSYCVTQCVKLIQQYTMGSKKIGFRVISDQTENFPEMPRNRVNFEDSNLNISIPIFSIHGNHDDPTGKRQISSLDLLAANKLVNYFGRWETLKDVIVKPIILQKGETNKIALYGLSHISDERLGRLFLKDKVKFYINEDMDEAFNLLVLHQNRAARGPKNFIPANLLPDFMQLIIWGHEHDCRIDPELQENGTYISQPGSSVATSLSAGEAIEKKVGILKVKGNTFFIQTIPLKTVRPLIIDDMVLDFEHHQRKEEISKVAQEKIKKQIEEMITSAKNINSEMLPLIRLRVFYKDDRILFSTVPFLIQFNNSTANALEILQLTHLSERKKLKENIVFFEDTVVDQTSTVEETVLKTFEEMELKLNIFSVKCLNEAVMKYVNSGNSYAPIAVLEEGFKSSFEYVKKKAPDNKEIEQCVQNMRTEKFEEEEYAKTQALLSKIDKDSNMRKNSNENSDDEVMLLDSDDDGGLGTTLKTQAPTRGRGRGRGRARGQGVSTRGQNSTPKATRGGRGKKNATLFDF